MRKKVSRILKSDKNVTKNPTNKMNWKYNENVLQKRWKRWQKVERNDKCWQNIEKGNNWVEESDKNVKKNTEKN